MVAFWDIRYAPYLVVYYIYTIRMHITNTAQLYTYMCAAPLAMGLELHCMY